MIEHFSRRIDNFTVRTCPFYLDMDNIKKQNHQTAHITNDDGNGKTAHIIATWALDELWGFQLHFWGRRIFECIDQDAFFKLAKAGQDHLDNINVISVSHAKFIKSPPKKHEELSTYWTHSYEEDLKLYDHLILLDTLITDNEKQMTTAE